MSNYTELDPSPPPADGTTESPLHAALGELALEALISEIRRYLAAIDDFRGEGCEPRWT